jgi:thioredoxin reductase
MSSSRAAVQRVSAPRSCLGVAGAEFCFWLYDDGQHRNSASHTIHCLLGQEGTPPRKLYAAARGELQQYETVTLRPGRVTEVGPVGSQFSVKCSDGSSLMARKILLATGLKDVVPKLDGTEPLYGRSVHHCPYCDGFEHRDQPLAVYGAGDKGAGLARGDQSSIDDGRRVGLSLIERRRPRRLSVSDVRVS